MFVRRELAEERYRMFISVYILCLYVVSYLPAYQFGSFQIDIPVEHLERFYEGKLEVTRKFAYGMKLVQAELDKVMKEIEADKSSGPYPDEFMKQLVKFQEEDRKLHDLAVRDISILTASKEKLSKRKREAACAGKLPTKPIQRKDRK